jgi:hypothetical protein
MKTSIIAFGTLAAFGLFTSCTPEVEDTFGESAANRVAASQSRYYDILEAQTNGWALDFYPSDRIEGGVAYTARFKDGRVTMSCEQDITNTVVSTTYTVGTPVSSAYRIFCETGVILTFDTYNPLFHYWSQPFQKHAKGYQSDYEFTFVSASADSVVLRGKKYGNMLRMYPLKESATSYISKVAFMHATLQPISRKRVVADGKVLPITMAYNLFTYEHQGSRRSVPFIHTPEGIRFYEPVFLNGVAVSQLAYDSSSRELRSADGRVVMPNPSAAEQLFLTAQKQWYFSYKWSTGEPSDMCDELAAIIKNCARVVNNGQYGEKVRDLYLGANIEPFTSDRHRWVLGWRTRLSGSIDNYIGYAVDMNMLDADRQLIGIDMLEGANLFSNYGYWQTFVDFIGQNSPYLLTFDNADNPKVATLTSEKDGSKWFRLTLK